MLTSEPELAELDAPANACDDAAAAVRESAEADRITDADGADDVAADRPTAS